MPEIGLMKEFIESYYIKELTENVRLNKKRLSIDFKDLQFFPELAECALDEPEEFIRIGENAILELNENAKNFIVRIKNIPESSKIRIRDIKSKFINKLKVIEGYVTYKSDIRPVISSAKFECPSCGNLINVIQLEKDFIEPIKCSCGRRARFRIVRKENIDAYTMVIEEIPEYIKYGSELKKMNILVKKDLCQEEIEEKIVQGSKVQITGIIKESWKIKDKRKQTQLDIYFEANYIKLMDISFYDFKITQEDEKEIIKFSEEYKDPIKKMCKDVFSGVYGYEKEKEIIILQAIGGTTNISTKPIDRGNVHVLFIGEPGTGKSALLEVAFLLLPKVRRAEGTTSTSVGLIGATVPDTLLGGYHYEIGALPLSHLGCCIIDELDKLPDDDKKALHTPMEQLELNVHKGNVHLTLKCHTSILASANPKYGRFDSYQTKYEQMQFEDTLINRFDFVIPFEQSLDKEKEKEAAMVMLQRRKKKPDYQKLQFYQKYIAYAKNITPEWSNKAEEIVAEAYSQLISKGDKERKSIPITKRQLGSIIRITEARAKSQLQKQIKREHIEYALELMRYWLNKVAFDSETGTIDIDKIETGVSASQRGKFTILRDIIKELQNSMKPVPTESILEECRQRGIDENEFEQNIAMMIKYGDLFEPRSGFYQLI